MKSFPYCFMLVDAGMLHDCCCAHILAYFAVCTNSVIELNFISCGKLQTVSCVTGSNLFVRIKWIECGSSPIYKLHEVEILSSQ